MENQLKGKLEFISLFQPIKLDEIDLREYFFKLLENLNGMKAKMHYYMNSIEISADESSDKAIEYKNDENGILILLNNADGSFGMSNVGAYLSNILQHLNGMTVIVNVTNNSIKVTNDPTEKVFGIYYTRNNCCKIPDNKIKTICKIGKKDCCIFISASSEGFECLKFDSPSARMLLDRYSKKTNRIGNCKILGRIRK